MTSEAAPTAQGPTAEGHSAEELVDMLRRERADFLNYKRRQEHERIGDRQAARADVISRLLPTLDDLDRALTRLPQELADDQWAQGVVLSARQLTAALRELGVERVGREGEAFDPAVHEALFYEARPDASEARVAQVVRHGYRVGDRLLRPAQVVVAGPLRDDPRSTDGDRSIQEGDQPGEPNDPSASDATGG